MTVPSLVVRPVRFTDDLDAMRDFLALLGMRPRIEAAYGGWVDLTSRAGMVALHDAATSVTGGVPGETRLSFEVGDAESAAQRLRAAGFGDATAYDEAYGRVLVVSDPLGASVMLDERQDDLYGYRRLDVGAPEPLTAGVVPVRFTDRGDDYHRFLTALGLSGAPDPGGYATYDATGHGWVGVHHVYTDDVAELPVVGDHGVHLTLAVDGARGVDELQARLEAAGVAHERFDEDFGSFLDVTDPDGQSVQVHGVPTS